MNKHFWKGKRVLVTGHTGFVGTWMCAVLKHYGASVFGFSLKEEKGSLYEKTKDSLGIQNYNGDLRNYDEILECIENVKPEIVFHIAAYGFVKECFEDPVRAYSTNVQGTINLFEAVRHYGMPTRIVVASSDKVYKNNDKEMYLFSEGDLLGGSDPYSASKTCEDITCQSYYDSYLNDGNYSLSVIRPSNILGGGDHNINRLIPSMYHNLSNGEKPEIRNPDATRPWQNIFDIVDAYLTVAEKNENECWIYNVGPETDGIKTVGEIAEYVSTLYGVKADTSSDDKTDVKEKQYLGLSIEKIKEELNWQPRRTLNQTLEEIYEFYQNDDGKNTYDLCVSQIEKYYSTNEAFTK